MNKEGVIQLVADQCEITKTQAGRFVESFIKIVLEAASNGEPVTISGLGSFEVGMREMRMGRNPKTGESISLKAKMMPKFKPSAALRFAAEKAKI